MNLNNIQMDMLSCAVNSCVDYTSIKQTYDLGDVELANLLLDLQVKINDLRADCLNKTKECAEIEFYYYD